MRVRLDSYIIYSYKFERDDGRTQYPLLLIFYSPPGSPINVKMLSTNTKRHIMDKFQITKVRRLPEQLLCESSR